MSVKYNDKGEICICFETLLNAVSAEEKVSLIESLSCDEDILKHVTAQLLDGFTENVYHGRSMGGQAEPNSPLDKSKREIAKRSGEVAKKEIEDLERRLKVAEENYAKWMGKYYDLYHNRNGRESD